jgi:5-methylcytosine-specific restriction endonuclease McrA
MSATKGIAILGSTGSIGTQALDVISSYPNFFRLEVLTRDNYICQYCGGVATVVHHERPVKIDPFHAVDPDYGWACCERCHYEKGHPKETECSTGNLAAKVCEPIIKKKENFI